jgi:hypothetical protein
MPNMNLPSRRKRVPRKPITGTYSVWLVTTRKAHIVMSYDYYLDESQAYAAADPLYTISPYVPNIKVECKACLLIDGKHYVLNQNHIKFKSL